MCEEFNEELVKKWNEWLFSEEGKETMLNVANNIFIIGKNDKLEFVKPKKNEEGE